MQSAKILITDKIDKIGIDILENAGFKVKKDYSLDGDSLKEIISDYDGLIIRSGTQVTEDIIEAAVKLKIIGRAGTGVDNIDIPAATKHKILVTNVPGGNTVSASEHTMALMLSLVRNIPTAHNSLKEGKWDRKAYRGNELYGKTLGIVGLGKIGTEVAIRAAAFGMKVITCDPNISKDRADQIGVKLVSFEELLQNSDIVTIHVPVNDKTRGLFNKETIGKMKDGAYLINCARGAVVKSKALSEAIKNSKISGAAVDVYEEKPGYSSELIGLQRVVHTPHIGASTVEAQKRVAQATAEQIKEYILNGKKINAVNDI